MTDVHIYTMHDDDDTRTHTELWKPNDGGAFGEQHRVCVCECRVCMREREECDPSMTITMIAFTIKFHCQSVLNAPVLWFE